MKEITSIIVCIVLFFVLSACEDDPSSAYEPDVVIQSQIFVDMPIENIAVIRTQPMTRIFKYSETLIRNAKVVVKGDGRVFELKIDDDGDRGYYFPDKTYKIKPETKYSLEVTVGEQFMTGETTTPKRVEWKNGPADTLFYAEQMHISPRNPIENRTLTWKVPGKPDPLKEYFLIRLTCLDTLNYGKYLANPTKELNGRVNTKRDNREYYLEKSNWFPPGISQTPIISFAFKWFGAHEITVIYPDIHMFNNFQQNKHKSIYDRNLNNIKGGKGSFGSGSYAKDTTFLVK